MSQSADNDAPSSWTYRITREQVDGEDFFTVREVYTGDNGKLSWTRDAIAARGDSWLECADDLAKMSRAVGGPILDLTLDPPALVSPRDLRRTSVKPPGAVHFGYLSECPDGMACDRPGCLLAHVPTRDNPPGETDTTRA